mmetsp:Transcript_10700/g.21415  ORF Transcript_10700/g.21415 Transcript_10700/m.21415 type:complete len:151 (-) Transcript_10700:46-498(-)
MDDDISCEDIPICQVSNICIDNEEDQIFYQQATTAAENRLESGYDIEGKPGGEYSEINPPLGKKCGGFLKGNVGIIWKDCDKPPGKPSSSSSSSKESSLNMSDSNETPGYCSSCGYSLYHYADQECRGREGSRHPAWEGAPPPSFADANS